MPLSEEAQAAIRASPMTGLESIAEVRAMEVGFAAICPVPSDVTCDTVEMGGVSCDWVAARGVSRSQVLFWIHGGGVTIGRPFTHRALAAAMSLHTGMAVLLPDFCRAPESPWPLPMGDCKRAYLALLETVSASKVVVGGDSSGAGLAACMLAELRDEGSPLPACTVFHSPHMDWSYSGASYVTNRYKHVPADRVSHFHVMLETMARGYCGNEFRRDPRISAIFGDVTGLPPCHLNAGSEEVYLDDGLAYTDKLLRAGVTVQLRIWPELWHGWALYPTIPEAQQAYKEMAAFVRLFVPLA
eukprot:TRINITY_DN14101_c0_g1_i1.p1 TRINITY_DN14101_c0_g1~~TRINITY_DN14101_c0_g1_i1.p1  ORF type:complete len:300 (+),score=37.98 TRINITY_DN14101_c0_g1_i1:51-950(+)